MFKGFASSITQVTPTTVWPNAAVNPTVAQLTPVIGDGTGSRRVWGATVSNISGVTIQVAVATYPAAQVLWGAWIDSNQTIVIPIPFITNTGLAATTTVASAASFTFFHSRIT